MFNNSLDFITIHTVRIRVISAIIIVVLFCLGCKESTNVEDATSITKKNTNNDADLGYEMGSIHDYFYDFEERIDAKYLYYNKYITRGANTLNSINPYLDTLNFSTFPSYTLEIENQLDTISHQLAITAENINDYSTLYPLNELNTTEYNWCNNMLVKYDLDDMNEFYHHNFCNIQADIRDIAEAINPNIAKINRSK